MTFFKDSIPDTQDNPIFSVGLFADIHYADRDMEIGRYYRDSRSKVRQAVETFNQRKLAFCVHLGDLVDKGESVAQELDYLRTIEDECARFEGERHYVLGNHDVATFSKDDFLANCGAVAEYYSFDHAAYHFVLLDACYKSDGSPYNAGNFHWTDAFIPSSELEWLRSDLETTTKPTVLFVHQRLDDDTGPHGISNAPLIRQLLEASGNVRAVFQGHDHAGAYRVLNGIPYCTLRALIEGPGLDHNAYGILSFRKSGALFLEGFGTQPSLRVC